MLNGTTTGGNLTVNTTGNITQSAGTTLVAGGTANFVFVDGHAERMTVLDSLTAKLWGDRFYSISGQNTRVRMSP